MSVGVSTRVEEQPQVFDTSMASGSIVRLLWRAVRLRCPNCGRRGLFGKRMKLNERCASCGILLERGESDHFLGAYLFNLIVVELVLAAVLATVAIVTWPNPPWGLLQWGGMLLAIVLAVVCYPFAKSLWLAFDVWLRPFTAAERDIAAGAPREIAEELV
ncbi:MAG TPA: DUF983 domain-containing protein [Gemmatimonadales bacterium]|nr:DUF983 domain-containing protein [Gemmatimonadales bacterium]